MVNNGVMSYMSIMVSSGYSDIVVNNDHYCFVHKWCTPSWPVSFPIHDDHDWLVIWGPFVDTTVGHNRGEILPNNTRGYNN